MLIDVVEKKKKEGELIEDRRGACRFCGQISIVQVPMDWNDEQTDELAAETCECDDAKSYRYLERRKEKAIAAIDKQFGEENVTEKAIELMKQSVELVAQGCCVAVTVNTGNIKGKVSVNAKGAIKVEKTKTEKRSEEA